VSFGRIQTDKRKKRKKRVKINNVKERKRPRSKMKGMSVFPKEEEHTLSHKNGKPEQHETAMKALISVPILKEWKK